jgi:hypothetical protein
VEVWAEGHVGMRMFTLCPIWTVTILDGVREQPKLSHASLLCDMMKYACPCLFVYITKPALIALPTFIRTYKLVYDIFLSRRNC